MKILKWVIGVWLGFFFLGLGVGYFRHKPPIQIKGNVVSSRPLGMSLIVPDAWKIKSNKSEVDVLIEAADGSAMLGIGVAKELGPIESSMDNLLKVHIEKFGKPLNLVRDKVKLGKLDAVDANYGVATDGGIVKKRVIMINAGGLTFCFTCADNLKPKTPKRPPCGDLFSQLELK